MCQGVLDRLAMHPAGQDRALGPLSALHAQPRAPRSGAEGLRETGPSVAPSHPPPTHRSAGLRRIPAARALLPRWGEERRSHQCRAARPGAARLLCPIRGAQPNPGGVENNASASVEKQAVSEAGRG